jgi:DNA-binding PadR family transcriptional regulator
MKIWYSAIEQELLTRLSRAPAPQAQLVENLSPLAGEGYVYTRIRLMNRRGLITKNKRDGRVWCSITPQGLSALEIMKMSTEAGL